jgi:hypothetical protein
MKSTHYAYYTSIVAFIMERRAGSNLLLGNMKHTLSVQCVEGSLRLSAPT